MAEKILKNYLNDRTIKILRATQRKYEGDFMGFYRSLRAYYIPRKGAERDSQGSITYEVTREMDKIKQTVKAIDGLLSPTGVTQAQIDTVNKLMDDVEKDLKLFQDQAAKDIKLNENLEKLNEKRGLNTSKLMQQQKVIRGRINKKPSKIPEGLRLGIGDAVGHVATSVLGPLAGLAGAGIDIARKHREKKVTAERKALAGTLLLEKEQIPEAQTEMFQGLFGAKTSISKTIQGKSRKSFAGSFNPFVNTKIKSPAVGSGGTAAGLGTSLFTFFQHDAYKANWTRDLLGAIKKIAGMPSGTKGKSDITVMPSMGLLNKTLVGLGKTLAVAGSAFAGWKAGRFIGENLKVGDKSVDEWVEKGATNLMVGSKKTQLKKQQKLTGRPEIKRALELQAQGVPVREAVLQARRELGLDSTSVPSISETVEKSSSDITKVIQKEKEKIGMEHVVNEKGFKDVVDSIKEMGEKLSKKASTVLPSFFSGNFQATNIGDPMLESLNMGSLDVE